MPGDYGTNPGGLAKTPLLHISCCGYPVACPQAEAWNGLQAGFSALSANTTSCPWWSIFCLRICWMRSSDIFEKPLPLFYIYKGYTRIVVVVNGRHFLWISVFFSKKSWTWMLYKPVNDSVLPCCQFWTDFGPVYKEDFVHNRYLWICRTLSTGTCFCSLAADLSAIDAVAGSFARFCKILFFRQFWMAEASWTFLPAWREPVYL